ncbi:MAG: hypothetical protein OXC03_10900 [Flavobacteriaceae bacterium]|nr:hypothetical protein [Flavobacteriaceae bacterium]
MVEDRKLDRPWDEELTRDERESPNANHKAGDSNSPRRPVLVTRSIQRPIMTA